MTNKIDRDDLRLNYNPEAPQERFKAAGLKAALIAKASDRLPGPVPWPAGSQPKPAPLKTAPAETDDLTKFKDYDAVVVTYTSAEAAALATLFTPGYPTSAWYEYRHNITAYIPLVTGAKAPFNATAKEDARYYHSLGLYFPCTIGKAKVLLFKSGLHLDHDGPATPYRKLMDELLQMIQPKIFITTGTGGGIGTDVALGDVVIAGLTKFYCPKYTPDQPQFKGNDQFADKTKYPWNADSYNTTPVPAKALTAITPALTSVNAARIHEYNPRAVPKIWSAATDAIVTTDFFAFDDSQDTYKLQGLGQACDMGDAMVGNVMQNYPNVKWFAIRNASDPQIPNPTNDIKTAGDLSDKIYSDYGVFTSAASVIASWAVIDAIINP
jgi:nucleoside phosphorylase